MKKFLKSNKRWIAFFLAFLLVATTCVTSSDAFLWATGEDEEAISEQAESESGPVEEVVEMDVEEEETEETEETEEADVDSETEEVAEDEEQQVSEEDAEQENGEDETDEQAPVDEEIPEEDVIEEDLELVGEADTYGYAVYYYYDGEEDESARVEDEGALGDVILASVEEEAEYNGKDYVLDHVENEDGKISEDAEQNVVKVYYVLVEETEIETYSFELKTVLSDGGKAEVVSPKEGGKYEAGEEVSFIVTVKEGYKLADVAKQDDTKLSAESEQDGTYSYKVTISENTVVTVTFEKEAVEMPAQVLQAKAGNVSVTITAPEGVLPAGTTAKAVLVTSKSIAEAINDQVAEEGKEVVGFTAVDITLYDKDGNEIQPNGELKVTFDNVSTFDEAEEAAVFHVDPSKKIAEKIEDVDANAGTVKFDANHFSIYVKADISGVQTMSITGPNTVKVGEKITLRSDARTHLYDRWSVNRSNLAEISYQEGSSTAQVTGKAAGTVTITHRYMTYSFWYGWIWQEETFDLTVEGVSSERVYVYLKLDIDEETAKKSGWGDLNGNGWYTIGYVDVEGIDAASKYKDDEYASDAQKNKVIEAIKDGKLVRHTSSSVSFDFTKVQWSGTVDSVSFGLKAVDDGAIGFDETGYAWHMDGYLKINEIVDCNLTINYLYGAGEENEGELIHEPYISKTPLKTGEEYSVLSPVIRGYKADTPTVSGKAANGDITRYVYYTKDPDQWFRVSYDPGATGVTGEIPPTTEECVGSTVTKSSVELERTGYEFGGWETRDVIVEDDGTFKMPTNNVVFTAKWIPSTNTKYRVEYYYQNDGTYPQTTTYFREGVGTTETSVAATEADKTPDTTIEGIYVFDEFNSNNELKKTIAADGSTVLKVYFKQQYIVTYDLDRGTSTSSKLVHDGLDYGAETPTIAQPTKAGYTFNGWNVPKGTIANTVTESVTYKALWTPNTNTTYKVEHYLETLKEGVYATTPEKTDHLTGTTDTLVTAKAETFSGFEYNESASAETKNGTITGDGELVLKLYYTRKSYTVTYSYENNVPGASTLPVKATYKYGEKVTVEPKATAPGYTFNGWSRTEDFTMPAENVEIKGSFTANGNTAYKVQHYLQNLDNEDYYLPTDSANNENHTGQTGTTATATPKTFDGFKYNESASEDTKSGTITGDGNLVLELYYTRNSYDVTYSYTGLKPVGASELPAKATYKYGKEVEVEDAATADGYDFSGWTTANTNVTLEEGKFTMPASDVTFTGEFTAREDTAYKVEYYWQDLNDNNKYTLALTDDLTGTTGETATAEVKTFEGFTYNKDVPGTVVSGTIAGNGSLVLKLYYTRNNNYTVVYTDGVDDEVVFSDQRFESLAYGSDTPVFTAPTRTGYAFTSWSPTWQYTVTNTGATLDPETNNYVITYTAQWVENYSIEKKLTSTPPVDDAHKADTYNVGDKLTYKITVTNNIDAPITNVVVGDQLQNASGKVEFVELPTGVTVNDDNTVTIATLPAKASVTLKCEYVITDADAALNTDLADTDPANAGIKNVATGKVDGEESKETDPTDPALTEEMYTLIVQYRYADGRAAAGTVTEYHKAGTVYTVPVPTIEGYASNYVAVTGTMPKEDVLITVLYTASGTPGTPGGGGGGGTTPTPPTPPTPDGPNPIVVPDIPVPAGAIPVVVPVAPAGQALEAVDDEEVPLQGAQIDIDDDGNVTVTPIDEEEIPLAGGLPDIHFCCILHFLLMLAALIIYTCFTDSMRRRQKKLAELKDELVGRVR